MHAYYKQMQTAYDYKKKEKWKILPLKHPNNLSSKSIHGTREAIQYCVEDCKC